MARRKQQKADASFPLAQLAVTPSEPAADTRLLERATAAVDQGLASLTACINAVTQELAGRPYDTKLASHLAYLTQHVISVLDGVRKLEAHDQRAVKAMSPDERDQLVVSYIGDLPQERKEAILALLHNTQTVKSVL